MNGAFIDIRHSRSVRPRPGLVVPLDQAGTRESGEGLCTVTDLRRIRFQKMVRVDFDFPDHDEEKSLLNTL